MKVAICLSGEPRDFDYIWNDLLIKINQPNAHFYIHTWFSDKKISTLPEHHDRGSAYQNAHTQISSKEYITRINPIEFLVEDYYKSHPYIRFLPYKIPSTITRMYSMFYSIQQVTNIVNRNNYDYIIRMRPDLYLENPLDWNSIEMHLEKNPNVILTPDLWINIGGLENHWTEKLNYWPDFFCIYKSNNSIFTKIYDEISNYCGLHTSRNELVNGYLPCIPELYLAEYCKSNGTEIDLLNFKMMLSRHHRQIINNEPIF